MRTDFVWGFWGVIGMDWPRIYANARELFGGEIMLRSFFVGMKRTKR
jgi:hypothetical protein